MPQTASTKYFALCCIHLYLYLIQTTFWTNLCVICVDYLQHCIHYISQTHSCTVSVGCLHLNNDWNLNDLNINGFKKCWLKGMEIQRSNKSFQANLHMGQLELIPISAALNGQWQISSNGIIFVLKVKTHVLNVVPLGQ